MNPSFLLHHIWLFLLLLVSVSLMGMAGTTVTAESAADGFVRCVADKAPKLSVYTPADANYTSVLNAYVRNLRFSTPNTPKPVAIATPTQNSDVQAAVVCLKNSTLQLRIRSGGHDYDGLSYVSSVPFVVLDLSQLRSLQVHVAKRTAFVQAGAILGEIYYAVANASDNTLAFPAGVCFALGAGGHISGGGYGALMRKYGLSIDNVIDAEIVDAEGRLLDRRGMGEDVFWAIRGGGGGSFGVIVSWTLKLVPVPSKVTVFSVDKTLEEGAADAVLKWQEVADKVDDELFIRLLLSPAAKNTTAKTNVTVKAEFVALYLGPSQQLLGLMKRSFPELGVAPKDVTEMTWLESTLFWVDLPAGTPTTDILKRAPGAIYLKRKSDYVKTAIPKEALGRIFEKLIEMGPGVGMTFNPYGGAMARIPSTATAFPHRAGNKWKIQYSVNWFQGGTAPDKQHLDMIRELYAFMTPYVSKDPREAFLNYRDVDIGSTPSNFTDPKLAAVYGNKYFKDNYQKLRAVKRSFDPNNFFKNEQSIPPLA